MKKVGLFGGSFDPIHKIHTYIATLAIQQLELDELQFIPTQNNPWKDTDCASAKDRFTMIQIAIQDSKKMSINTIELENESDEKNYTIETIRKLKFAHPNNEYFYIMGMDQASLFDKWRDAKELSELVRLVAFQRGNYQANENLNNYHFILLENTPVIASSSDVRNGHIEFLDDEVLKYITSQGLYLETMLKSKMSDKRWKHTISVAYLARDIAESNNLDAQKAYIAGMFHDIAKEMDYDQAKKIMKENFPDYIEKPIAIWHQWISRYVAKEEYLIDDCEVLDAIEHHTTGSVKMSKIGKCVYVADKLDPLRGYDSSKQIEICKQDINQGFKDSLNDFYEFSKKNQREIDDCFYEIYDYFVTEGEI